MSGSDSGRLWALVSLTCWAESMPVGWLASRLGDSVVRRKPRPGWWGKDFWSADGEHVAVQLDRLQDFLRLHATFLNEVSKVGEAVVRVSWEVSSGQASVDVGCELVAGLAAAGCYLCVDTYASSDQSERIETAEDFHAFLGEGGFLEGDRLQERPWAKIGLSWQGAGFFDEMAVSYLGDIRISEELQQGRWGIDLCEFDGQDVDAQLNRLGEFLRGRRGLLSEVGAVENVGVRVSWMPVRGQRNLSFDVELLEDLKAMNGDLCIDAPGG